VHRELARRRTDAWLWRVSLERRETILHDTVVEALRAARPTISGPGS